MSSRLLRQVTLLLGLLCLTLPVAGQDPTRPAGTTTLEVMDLYHRSAEELLPLLQPLLSPHEAASGQGDKLLLRVAPGRLSQVRELVERLDTPLRNLRVTLRLASAADLEELALEGRGRIGPGGGEVNLGAWRASTDRNRNWVQQVRVLEGHEAVFRVGQELPRLKGLYLGPVEQGVEIEYYPLTYGLRVLPRVTGQRVTVEIAPHDRQLDGAGRVQTRELATTVAGPLGQWLLLGGVEEGSQATASTRRLRQEDLRLLLKVEELP